MFSDEKYGWLDIWQQELCSTLFLIRGISFDWSNKLLVEHNSYHLQIMEIQDLQNQFVHNQTKLILTRLNQTQPNQAQLNQTKPKTKPNSTI